MDPNLKPLLVSLLQPQANPALAAKQARLLKMINSDLNSKPPAGSSASPPTGATPAQLPERSASTTPSRN